jgi:glycine/D-amino acid oxidase-like deaminating enzyme
MTKYGGSPWVDNFPKSRVPSFPRQRGTLSADVAIIGGGLTGCATAYAFAAAGVKVVLLEADTIGRGSSAFSTGWISDDPGASFVEVEKLLGLRVARHAWRSWRRAALDFSALIRRLDIKCYLEPCGSLLIAAGPDQVARLKREQKVRREAGLDATVVNARAVAADAAVSADAAIRSRDGASLDPYRATLGLLAAAVERGAQIFEKSPVRRTRFTRRSASVHTAAGTIRVSRIVVATGVPTMLFSSLRRHFWFKSAFAAMTERVPAKIRRGLGPRRVVVRDTALPPHVVRWVNDEHLLVTGADSKVIPPRLQSRALIQRTGQLMYELSTLYPDISGILPEYGWETPYALTTEGIPYIGPHRNFPHHLFAFGDASHSVTGGYLASRIFLRYHLDQVDSADLAFSFTR